MINDILVKLWLGTKRITDIHLDKRWHTEMGVSPIKSTAKEALFTSVSPFGYLLDIKSSPDEKENEETLSFCENNKKVK